MRLNPLTVRKLKRFREIRRGYYSAVLLVALTGLSLFAELMVSDRAIIVSYQGEWTFPTYAGVKLGAEYGRNYIWKWHTWLPFYILAGFFKVLGESAFTARLPFALFLLLVFFWSAFGLT